MGAGTGLGPCIAGAALPDVARLNHHLPVARPPAGPTIAEPPTESSVAATPEASGSARAERRRRDGANRAVAVTHFRTPDMEAQTATNGQNGASWGLEFMIHTPGRIVAIGAHGAAVGGMPTVGLPEV